MPQSRILFIDAYDSFSNNITTLLRDNLPVTLEVIKHDDARFVFNDDAFQNFLNKFDAVVAGPGPGHPGNASDVGLIAKLWYLPDDYLLPVLGICLGFQSFALAFGASIERLKEPRHGLVRRATHGGYDIFTGMGELEATQYHSLQIRLGPKSEHDVTNNLQTPARACKHIIPLAWDLSDEANGRILIGGRHCHLPFWGVQYHPESICSTGGALLIRNWWAEVYRWNASRLQQPTLQEAICSTLEPRDAENGESPTEPKSTTVRWKAVQLQAAVDTAHLVGSLRATQDSVEPIVLESGTRDGKPVNLETGRYSIIGLPSKGALQIRWSVKDRLLVLEDNGKIKQSKRMPVTEIFSALESIVEANKAEGGPSTVPFWGGLVGYISYEAGLETIDVAFAESERPRPDVWFVLVERSVVIDRVANVAYVQSIAGDEEWLSKTVELNAHVVIGPEQDKYCAKVSACQEQLRAGESYELCLTDQTLVRNPADPWTLYQRLRQTNPAPFGAYLRFSDAHASVGVDVIGSSPERFLSWSRDGECQFRPIKGTVKKTPGMTRAKAEELLGSEKERAENLMIVDLIRHDLNGVEGVRDVRVPKLMCVEEYETVFQLVSVIEGDLVASTPHTAALAQSLPPGSMTGAPKKRSCELLRRIEGIDKPRGLYSGVLGYMDVGGGGDFSVVIRTAFKWADEEVWRVGAGGAVTALSKPLAEWEEMLAKRQSLLDVLLASSP